MKTRKLERLVRRTARHGRTSKRQALVDLLDANIVFPQDGRKVAVSLWGRVPGPVHRAGWSAGLRHDYNGQEANR